MKDSLRMPIDCSHSYYSMVDVLYVAEKALKFAGMKRPWRLRVGKLKNSLGFIWLWDFPVWSFGLGVGWGFFCCCVWVFVYGFWIFFFFVCCPANILKQSENKHTTTAHMVPVLELR